MFDRRKGEKVRPSDQLNILMELACTQGGGDTVPLPVHGNLPTLANFFVLPNKKKHFIFSKGP